MACPACGRDALFAPSNPWRPFCSERCRLIDLGAWADGSYGIPAQPGEGGTDEDANEIQKP